MLKRKIFNAITLTAVLGSTALGDDAIGIRQQMVNSSATDQQRGFNSTFPPPPNSVWINRAGKVTAKFYFDGELMRADIPKAGIKACTALIAGNQIQIRLDTGKVLVGKFNAGTGEIVFSKQAFKNAGKDSPLIGIEGVFFHQIN